VCLTDGYVVVGSAVQTCAIVAAAAIDACVVWPGRSGLTVVCYKMAGYWVQSVIQLCANAVSAAIGACVLWRGSYFMFPALWWRMHIERCIVV
jgi:hypothetical protein